MGKVLIIDDEAQLRGLLARIIGLEGYEVWQADSCKNALIQLEQINPDVVICDVCLPDGSGVELITEMKKLNPLAEIILLTAHGNISDGVQAIKNRAFDYITKGDDNNKILPLLSRAVEKAEMARRLQQLEKQVEQKYSFNSIWGKSKSILDAIGLARKVAVTDVPVLLTGETGTAATNRDLQKEIETGNFREDLYYRLSVFRIQLPPLRERTNDIELYARSFIKMFEPILGKRINDITPDYLNALKRHPWKGNVRELRNVIERSMIMADSPCLTLSDLPLEMQQDMARNDSEKGNSDFDLAQMEKLHIRKVLQYTDGNKTEAARLMHIGLTTLYRKIEEYKIK